MKQWIKLLIFSTLFIFVSAVQASPASFQQFYESIYRTPSGQTNEVLSFEEGGELYQVDVKADSSVEVYWVSRPTGEVFPHAAYGGSDLLSADAVIGYFNGDTFKDIAVCNANPARQNSILFGVGDGTFVFGPDFGLAGSECSGIDAAQVDGVHGDDLVIANANGQLEVWMSDATGAMVTRQPYGSASGYSDVAFGTISFTAGVVDPAIDFFAVSNTVEEVWIGSGTGLFTLDASQPSLINAGDKVVVADTEPSKNEK